MTKTALPLPVKWNVLTSPWIEAVLFRGRVSHISPLHAFAEADKIHRVVSENPLDVFAAHRFLLTLLYWLAGDAKTVMATRKKLLQGEVPALIGRKLMAAADQFNLFDQKAPFLQDPSAMKAKRSSAAYLFAEMASGTNVAHFHHGNDETSRLCLECATRGLLRVVPWMQAGGAGLSPAVHGAPPIMPLALGTNLCQTLGLNLVPLDVPHGTPRWSGQFRPAGLRVKVMEGLTWNARRIHLLEPRAPAVCSRCGNASLPTVGPIVFEKNDACKKDVKRVWRDPAAFYSFKNGVPFATVKSGKEAIAAGGSDIRNLFQRTYGKKVEPAPSSLVVDANSTHRLWYVVVPCTNPANNKSFDHRAVSITEFGGGPPASEPGWPKDVPVIAGLRFNEPLRIEPSPGMFAFVRGAAALTAADWSVIAGARSMDDDPAAFDVFTGIYWAMRNKHPSLPCRPAAWAALKLMADAGRLRPSGRSKGAKFRPWVQLPLHQPAAVTQDGIKRYPYSIPRGDRLESELRRLIRKCLSTRSAEAIDWPGTCQFLHEVFA